MIERQAMASFKGRGHIAKVRACESVILWPGR